MASSEAGDLVGWGFGVFSGSSVLFFSPVDLSFEDFAFAPVFFFLADLAFGVADGVFEGLGEGVGRRLSVSSSSESEALAGDFLGVAAGLSSLSS